MIEIASIPVNWTGVVQEIRRGEQAAIGELYVAIISGVRPRLARSLGNESPRDRVHEVLVIVVEAIQRGELRDPERLMGFVQTVARRLIVAHLRTAILDRRHLAQWGSAHQAVGARDPEQWAARRELIARARKAVARLNPIDSQILQRFYFQEQSPERICREMELTHTQFRLRKSRGLARCIALTRRQDPTPRPLLARTA